MHTTTQTHALTQIVVFPDLSVSCLVEGREVQPSTLYGVLTPKAACCLLWWHDASQRPRLQCLSGLFLLMDLVERARPCSGIHSLHSPAPPEGKRCVSLFLFLLLHFTPSLKKLSTQKKKKEKSPAHAKSAAVSWPKSVQRWSSRSVTACWTRAAACAARSWARAAFST